MKTEGTAMETIHRFSHRLLPLSSAAAATRTIPTLLKTPVFKSKSEPSNPNRFCFLSILTNSKHFSSLSLSTSAKAGWFLGLGDKKKISLPDIVKAGDPVLHEPARGVVREEIKSEKIQKIIDDMIQIMRKAPGVGLAAPQIGIPLRIIVLEDTPEYISYTPKELNKAQDRHPFDLLVVVNPKLKKKSDRTALFFEGCLSVDGYRAMVERYLDIEVTGLDRKGNEIKLDASGWQARIFQHECDHLEGILYVDKMVPRSFRTVENLELPVSSCCPKEGVRSVKDR